MNWRSQFVSIIFLEFPGTSFLIKNKLPINNNKQINDHTAQLYYNLT